MSHFLSVLCRVLRQGYVFRAGDGVIDMKQPFPSVYVGLVEPGIMVGEPGVMMGEPGVIVKDLQGQSASEEQESTPHKNC